MSKLGGNKPLTAMQTIYEKLLDTVEESGPQEIVPPSTKSVAFCRVSQRYRFRSQVSDTRDEE